MKFSISLNIFIFFVIFGNCAVVKREDSQDDLVENEMIEQMLSLQDSATSQNDVRSSEFEDEQCEAALTLNDVNEEGPSVTPFGKKQKRCPRVGSIHNPMVGASVSPLMLQSPSNVTSAFRVKMCDICRKQNSCDMENCDQCKIPCSKVPNAESPNSQEENIVGMSQVPKLENRFGDDDDEMVGSALPSKKVYHLASITNGNIKRIILTMLGVADITDIETLMVFVTTRSNRIPRVSETAIKTPAQAQKLSDDVGKSLSDGFNKKIAQNQPIDNNDIQSILDNMPQEDGSENLKQFPVFPSENKEFDLPKSTDDLSEDIKNNPDVIEGPMDPDLLGSENKNTVKSFKDVPKEEKDNEDIKSRGNFENEKVGEAVTDLSVKPTEADGGKENEKARTFHLMKKKLQEKFAPPRPYPYPRPYNTYYRNNDDNVGAPPDKNAVEPSENIETQGMENKDFKSRGNFKNEKVGEAVTDLSVKPTEADGDKENEKARTFHLMKKKLQEKFAPPRPYPYPRPYNTYYRNNDDNVGAPPDKDAVEPSENIETQGMENKDFKSRGNFKNEKVGEAVTDLSVKPTEADGDKENEKARTFHLMKKKLQEKFAPPRPYPYPRPYNTYYRNNDDNVGAPPDKNAVEPSENIETQGMEDKDFKSRGNFKNDQLGEAVTDLSVKPTEADGDKENEKARTFHLMKQKLQEKFAPPRPYPYPRPYDAHYYRNNEDNVGVPPEQENEVKPVEKNNKMIMMEEEKTKLTDIPKKVDRNNQIVGDTSPIVEPEGLDDSDENDDNDNNAPPTSTSPPIRKFNAIKPISFLEKMKPKLAANREKVMQQLDMLKTKIESQTEKYKERHDFTTQRIKEKDVVGENHQQPNDNTDGAKFGQNIVKTVDSNIESQPTTGIQGFQQATEILENVREIVKDMQESNGNNQVQDTVAASPVETFTASEDKKEEAPTAVHPNITKDVPQFFINRAHDALSTNDKPDNNTVSLDEHTHNMLENIKKMPHHLLNKLQETLDKLYDGNQEKPKKKEEEPNDNSIVGEQSSNLKASPLFTPSPFLPTPVKPLYVTQAPKVPNNTDLKVRMQKILDDIRLKQNQRKQELEKMLKQEKGLNLGMAESTSTEGSVPNLQNRGNVHPELQINYIKATTTENSLGEANPETESQDNAIDVPSSQFPEGHSYKNVPVKHKNIFGDSPHEDVEEITTENVEGGGKPDIPEDEMGKNIEENMGTTQENIVGQMVPSHIATRGHLDETSSKEWTPSLGKIVQSSSKPSDVFFLGNGVKLPLKISKDNDGSVSLQVDLNRLCDCKNTTTCLKEHADISETVGAILEKEAQLEEQMKEDDHQQLATADEQSSDINSERRGREARLNRLMLRDFGRLKSGPRKFMIIKRSAKHLETTTGQSQYKRSLTKDHNPNSLDYLNQKRNEVDKMLSKTAPLLSQIEKTNESFNNRLKQHARTVMDQINKLPAKEERKSFENNAQKMLDNLSKVKPTSNMISRNSFDEKYDDVAKIKGVFQFKKLENDLENKLKKMDEQAEKISSNNEKLLDNLKTSFKVHEDNVVKEEVDILNKFISWMKSFTN